VDEGIPNVEAYVAPPPKPLAAPTNFSLKEEMSQEKLAHKSKLDLAEKKKNSVIAKTEKLELEIEKQAAKIEKV